MKPALALALMAGASWSCKKQTDQEPLSYQGPLAIAYGNCGDQSSVFEVGPRTDPAPNGPATAAADDPELLPLEKRSRAPAQITIDAGVPDSAPPPPPDSAPPNTDHSDVHQAGANNPLARIDREIQQCLRRFHREDASVHGHLAVQLTIDSTGLVVATSARGSRDAALVACVTNEAKELTFGPSERPSRIHRCPLAFSDGDARHLPALDIAGGTISYAGNELLASSDVQAPSESLMVAPIRDSIEKQREAARQAAGEAWIVTTGPLAIRPADDIPSRVVVRAVYSAVAGGARVVLAAREGASWRLLRDVPIPSPPVLWNAGASEDPALAPKGPALSILVGETALWAGSTSGERQELANRSGGTRDQAGLKSILERWRSHLGEDGSRRIEIAADDSVPYEDLVFVVDAANQARFTDWALVTPSSLSVQFR